MQGLDWVAGGASFRVQSSEFRVWGFGGRVRGCLKVSNTCGAVDKQENPNSPR